MNRAVTAIYRTHAVAKLVADEIASLGVARGHIDIIPDADDHLAAGTQRDDHVIDELHDLYLPEDDVRTYQQAVRRGDFVVSANVDDEHLDRVMEIMRRPEEEMYDIDATEEEFRSAEYVPPAHYGAAAGTAGDATETITEAEERLTVGKRDVDRGSVHVRSYVHEVPVEERVRLRKERVAVRRNAVGERVLSGAEADAVFQERSIDVREHDEEAVVSKETVVTGEVEVTKDVDVEEKVVTDTVRKTEVEVDDDRK